MNGWGEYMADRWAFDEVNELGSRLSVVLDCPVRYPAFSKRLFECKCGVVFPVYLVASKDWKMLKNKHIEERQYALRS